MVKYQVQFKPINPVNNSPMQNENTYVGYDSTTANNDYDCVLMYVRKEWTAIDLDYHRGYVPHASYKNITHPVWCVYAQVDTVKQAMKIAKPMIQKYGTQNVQIVQVVPASTEIVFEEE